jgi:cytochrome c oxidase subunit 2
MHRRWLLVACLFAITGSSANAGDDRVVRVTAKRFAFSPSTIRLKPGESVILELTSLDRRHGFAIPDLGIDATIDPGAPTRVTVTATKKGKCEFHCDVFCGEGHEDMTGEIVVE